ncbi:MAG: hypothetical protein ACPHGY_11725, partial [Rhodospirillaceae bacterium]
MEVQVFSAAPNLLDIDGNIKMINKNDLIEYFFKGIKPIQNLKIGVEHEKFILNKNTLRPLSYDEDNGIKNILERWSTEGW